MDLVDKLIGGIALFFVTWRAICWSFGSGVCLSYGMCADNFLYESCIYKCDKDIPNC